MKLLKDLRLAFKNYVYLALGISTLALTISLVSQRILPPSIPLFYGQPEGEGQLATSIFLIIPSVFSLLIVVINSGVSLFIKDDFLKRALVLTSLATSIFALIATIKIVSLVGNL